MLSRAFAFSLPIALFLYWSVIGYATLAILYSQRNHLQNLLLAPTIGLSVQIVLIFLPNWFGIPIEKYAVLLGVSLLICSCLILIYKRPLIPIRRYLPFVLCFCISLYFMGHALFQYGLNWLSFGNDDMINYALGSIRFLHHGYNETPALNDFLNGRDYSAYYWFMHVAGMERAGSELLLAWLAQVTRLPTLQIFMPLIVSLNLTLLSSAGALSYRSKRWRPIAIAVCFLLALSGLQALGVFYQLIAQIFGISLLLATITLVFKHYDFMRYGQVVKYAVLFGVVLAAVTICYPEVSPFLIISYVVFVGYSFYQGFRFNRYYWALVLLSFVFTLIIINFYFINYFVFLLQQVTGSGLTKAVSSIFPYLLVPAGLANLWNILPISYPVHEPWLSLGIVCADLIMIAMIIAALYQIKRFILPTAIFSLVMVVMGCMWFINNQGFVLFKLAMYAQPFIMTTFVVGCYSLLHKKYALKIPLWVIPILLLGVAGWKAQLYYLERSYGTPGSFVEFPNASKLGLMRQAMKQINQVTDISSIIFTTSNMVGEKLLSTIAYQHPTFLMSRHIFPLMMRAFWVPTSFKRKINPALWDQAEAIASKVENYYETVLFNLHNPPGKLAYDKMWVYKNNPVHHAKTYAFDASDFSIFNRWKLEAQKDKGLVFLSADRAINFLTYIDSKHSQNYYLGEDEFITLYGYQVDWFYPERLFAAVGKYLMLQLIQPTAKARIMLDYTATLNPDRGTKLPSTALVGAERTPFPVVGYGSARISVPVIPQWIKGIPYVLIDIGNEAKYYDIPRHGLMSLYGQQVTLDYKRVSAYVRDISLISEQEYQNRDAPRSIDKFPEGLTNKNLEYSGIYEEGWVGDSFYLNLKQPKQHNLLIIKGIYPLITDNARTTQMTVMLEGKRIFNTTLTPKLFDFKILIPDTPGIKHIVVQFSDKFALPDGDRRLVSAKLESIGFEKLYG